MGNGVRENSKDSRGLSATHVAVVNYNPQIAHYLLDHAADVNARCA
jgi:ankyrin repeat protein